MSDKGATLACRPVPRLLTAPLLALVLGLAACGGEDEEPAATAPSTEAPAAADLPEGCEAAEEPAPREDGGAEEPSGEVAPGTRVRFDTSCGAFTIELDVERAPKTSQSVASLARQGFYDGTTFHRVVPGFVIQGGDPTGTGTGGPGYSVEEAPPEDLAYTKGVVAMAKTGAEPPGTSGSQFYVVTGDDAGLPPEYALVGEVVEGLDVVERIGSVPEGGPPENRPLSPVVIRSAEVVDG
jgi:peptidyl-prolyl cis-trans isomerase B (cyclophilin B)